MTLQLIRGLGFRLWSKVALSGIFEVSVDKELGVAGCARISEREADSVQNVYVSGVNETTETLTLHPGFTLRDPDANPNLFDNEKFGYSVDIEDGAVIVGKPCMFGGCPTHIDRDNYPGKVSIWDARFVNSGEPPALRQVI